MRWPRSRSAAESNPEPTSGSSASAMRLILTSVTWVTMRLARIRGVSSGFDIGSRHRDTARREEPVSRELRAPISRLLHRRPIVDEHLVGQPIAEGNVDDDARGEGDQRLPTEMHQLAEARGQTNREEGPGESPTAQVLHDPQRIFGKALRGVGLEHHDDGGGEE